MYCPANKACVDAESLVDAKSLDFRFLPLVSVRIGPRTKGRIILGWSHQPELKFSAQQLGLQDFAAGDRQGTLVSIDGSIRTKGYLLVLV